MLLSRTGEGGTGTAQKAADLLVSQGWAAQTWVTGSSQVNMGLMFRNEEDRDALPAMEGYVLDDLGFMFFEERVGPSSVRQYVSAVSRFHKLEGLESPTRTPLVNAMIQAYICKISSHGRLNDACRTERHWNAADLDTRAQIICCGRRPALQYGCICFYISFPHHISGAHGRRYHYIHAVGYNGHPDTSQAATIPPTPLASQVPMQPRLARLDQPYRLATLMVCRQSLDLRLLQPPRWCPPRYRPP